MIIDVSVYLRLTFTKFATFDRGGVVTNGRYHAQHGVTDIEAKALECCSTNSLRHT